MTTRAVSRRRFLAGLGTLVALPALDSLQPSRVARADGTPPVRRLVTFHFPIGVNRDAWRATGTERDFVLGASQEPLAPFKDRITIVTGVSNTGQRTGTAIHTSNAATFLTADDAPSTAHAMGTSADQVVAASLSGVTRFRSLELGTSVLNENPNKEPGYDPVLKDHLSWQNGTPLPKEVNPSAVFDRLFSSGGLGPEAAARRRRLDQSVLDAVREDARDLQKRVGKADGRKLDEYLTGVRELELRIQATSTSACSPGARPGPPSDVRDRVRQMLDLTVLALRCDLTRVVTFGYEHTVTEQTHPWVGVSDGYHIGVTHNQPGAPYAAVNKWIVSQLAYLLSALDAVREGTTSLLDATMIYFASEMADGTTHSASDLPIVVCGGGGGALQGGRLLARPGYGNGNVLLSLIRAMGVPASSFGNGFTESLPGLVTS